MFRGTPMAESMSRIGKILPENSAVKQTLAGRRKRFWIALNEELGPDWGVIRWKTDEAESVNEKER